MGRRKTYDRDDVIDASMHLFRRHGFTRTSTQMLEDHLGVNRYGIYAEFGSKQSLFEAVLAHYDQVVIEPRFAPLEAPDAGLEEIQVLMSFYGSSGDGPVAGRGCLLCNTAIEFGPHDPSDEEFVRRYLGRLSRGFRAALTSARGRGELRLRVDASAEAEFLTAVVLGLFVMLRAQAPPSVIEAAAWAAVEHVETLRADQVP